MKIEFSEFLASFSYAASTKRTYEDVLSRICARSQDLAHMTASELLEILNNSGWGNSRQCVALAACQKYIAWKYGKTHPALAAKIKRVQGKTQRSLDPETALKLLACFDTYTPKGARDLAICTLALDTGLRESELCRLQLADTDLEHRMLQVIVKGGQWEYAIFGMQTCANIDRWLHYRRIADGHGALFTHTKTGRGLTPEGLYNIVEEWGTRIGIKLSPHDLRRSMAIGGILINHAPERAQMELGRWKHSSMIKTYTRGLRLESLRKYLLVDRLLGYDEDSDGSV